jgi:hypothetical protein
MEENECTIHLGTFFIHIRFFLLAYNFGGGEGYGVLCHFQQYLVISWRSVLLVEETRVPGENQRPVASH